MFSGVLTDVLVVFFGIRGREWLSCSAGVCLSWFGRKDFVCGEGVINLRQGVLRSGLQEKLLLLVFISRFVGPRDCLVSSLVLTDVLVVLFLYLWAWLV